jgi:hypothetical protein
MGRTACTEPQQSYTSTPDLGRAAYAEREDSGAALAGRRSIAKTKPQETYTSTPPMRRTACTEPQ